MRPVVLACSLLALGLGGSGLASRAEASPEPRLPATAPTDTSGRPQIVLDYLDFPSDVPGASHFKKDLRTILYREVRRARWGAGSGSTITYRFFVTKLTLRTHGDVLQVTCHAFGQLPKGKTAKSTLTFSGSARERNAVVRRVLEIVARGVITRLAELERVRRGDLE